ncbi:PorP/SprF family type IX secretion system membrane protein [Carboxylicivirga sp. RSCT41]|uniref:PorP/SprF family type IX secretion system membrane protein n=1 Tax=Carboxylicivirga agarovorans TaxID=3417570 RepID=UPI003D35419A
MNQKTILTLIISLVCVSALAQQDPLYTQYVNNQLTFNAGYAGSNDMLSAQFSERHHWTGFNGRPTTRVLTVHMPVGLTKTNVGVSFINDEIGPVKFNSFYLDYAYRFQVSNSGYLSLGVKGGFDMFNAYLTEVPLNEIDDATFANNLEESFILNFGFGAYYVTPQYYVGFGIPRLVKNDINGGSNTMFEAESLNYYLSSGAVLSLSDYIKLRPSFQARLMWHSPVHLETMVWAIYNDRFWLGTGYRLHDAIHAGIQLQITEQIRVGYTYDFTVSRFNRYGGTGAHELSLCYDFRFRRKHVKSPRYF